MQALEQQTPCTQKFELQSDPAEQAWPLDCLTGPMSLPASTPPPACPAAPAAPPVVPAVPLPPAAPPAPPDPFAPPDPVAPPRAPDSPPWVPPSVDLSVALPHAASMRNSAKSDPRQNPDL